MDRPYGVLFISRRNPARSLMAEAVVNRHGKNRFQAFSAGVEPTAAPDPAALEILGQSGYPTENLQPKHWREFAAAGAPVLHFVFTLSDTASRDAFPEWPGKPAASHWRYPDPPRRQVRSGSEERVRQELSALERQMRTFMQLSFESLDRIALGKSLAEIGAEHAAAESAT